MWLYFLAPCAWVEPCAGFGQGSGKDTDICHPPEISLTLTGDYHDYQCQTSRFFVFVFLNKYNCLFHEYFKVCHDFLLITRDFRVKIVGPPLATTQELCPFLKKYLWLFFKCIFLGCFSSLYNKDITWINYHGWEKQNIFFSIKRDEQFRSDIAGLG